jgi:tetrapyrrole methylase family protein/MazG family protein
VYSGIVERLLEAAAVDEVTYGVPGHPLFGEATVRLLLTKANDIRIVDGVSFIEPACRLLGIDPLDTGLQLIDALAVREMDPSRPVLTGQVYNRRAASELKLRALRTYSEDHDVMVLHDLSLPAERTRTVALSALDHDDDFDHLTAVFFPALPREKNTRTFLGLRSIVGRLRGPDGCPWDAEQTHQTLRGDLLEETYEVLGAIDEEDPHALQDELGDLLNQVMFHAQIASERGDFDIDQVIEAVASKLVRRHPHVFAGVEVSGTDDVLRNWEAIKQAEKDGLAEQSTLAGVSDTLPALHQTAVMLERAARAGFKWPALDDVLDKLAEEVDELERATDDRDREAEFGDILFNLVNVGRYLGLDAESALRGSARKFKGRFREVERIASERGLDMHGADVATLLDLWEEARRVADFPGKSE